jgi:multiple sugar transport system ATP-binding protein
VGSLLGQLNKEENMAKIVLENVHKNYGAPQDAVKGASFTCKDGELLVLLGPSGCGKTTTLRMITGLETITSGTIMIGDRVVNDLTPQERNVAMAFETYALYPPLTVYENIAFPLEVMKLSPKEIQERVESVAESLSITDILDMRPDNLAGGQKQRVSLARALVRNPTVFLMDEPLSHVDADVRHRARADIKHLQVTSNATVIYVTHDQVEAVALADRVIVMDQGVIQQIGTPLDLYLEPANLFVAGFIGEPPMNLIEAQLSIDDGVLALELTEGEQNILFQDSQISNNWIKKLEGYDGKNLVIGIRPQQIQLATTEHNEKSGLLSGKLMVHEFLGNYGIAQVEVGQIVLESVTNPEIPQNVGDEVELRVNFDDINFFDPETTNRIS